MKTNQQRIKISLRLALVSWQKQEIQSNNDQVIDNKIKNMLFKIRQAMTISSQLSLLILALCFVTSINAQTLEGNWGYQTIPNSRQVYLYGSKVANNNHSGYSGTLRLELWASERAYHGGTISGYILGSSQLGSLSAGYCFNNVQHYATYNPPQNGWYNVVLVLTEYHFGEYKIVSWVNMPRQCFK